MDLQHRGQRPHTEGSETPIPGWSSGMTHGSDTCSPGSIPGPGTTSRWADPGGKAAFEAAGDGSSPSSSSTPARPLVGSTEIWYRPRLLPGLG